MVISRQEPVTLLYPISLPDISSTEALLKRYGIKTHYQIVLQFRPRLSEQELQELKDLQEKVVAAAKANDDPKHAYSMEAARKIALPKYNYKRSSIYLYRTGEEGYMTFPEEAAAEISAIMKSIDEFFKKNN